MSTRSFAQFFAFEEGSLLRLGMKLSDRQPLITTGMLRKARTDIGNTPSNLETASASQILAALYGYATLYSAGSFTDTGKLEPLRKELARRYGTQGAA